MSKFLDLGLGIAIINAYYSLSYFLMWCVALQHSYENDIEPFVWLTAYTCNVFLNVFLFLGLRKRDRLAVVIWFSLTLLWFVPKLYEHSRGCRLDERGSTYRVVNLIMESYVILSFFVMSLVYIYLPRRGQKTALKQYTTSAEPQDIQMLDLSAKVVATQVAEEEEEQQVCLPGSSSSNGAYRDQQVRSFEFHRAGAEQDDCSEE